MKYQSSKSGHKRRKHTTTLSKARRNPPDNDSQNVGGVETKKVKTGPYSYALSEIEKATASKKEPSKLLKNFLMEKDPKGRLVSSPKRVRVESGRLARFETKRVKKRVPYDHVMYKKALLAILNYAKSYGSISQAQLEEFEASIQGATVENSQAAKKACSLLGVVLPSKTAKVA